MSKAYFFAMFLLAASFTGCIEDSELEEIVTEEEVTNEEEEMIEPVGVDDNAGMPGIEILGLLEDGQMLVAAIYDPDGYVKAYNIESSDNGYLTGLLEDDDDEYIECNGLYLNDTQNPNDCFPHLNTIFVNICYELGDAVDQTITFTIKDNDGNEVSEQYNLVESDFENTCEDYYDFNDNPSIVFGDGSAVDNSDGTWTAMVTQSSRQEPLSDYSYFLKDDSGSTYVGGNGFGEIALQMLGGNEYGINMAYIGSDEALESRAANISADDGTVFPVHFFDGDYDGMLSAGDYFTIFGTGNSANGPAQSGWKLDILFDATGDIVGTVTIPA